MIKLKVNAKEFTVLQAYNFQYNFGEGKEVLRIKVSKNDHSYSELETEFLNVTTDIEHYEDNILVNKYTGFNRDFKCNYSNNEFDIEITKITQVELELAQTKADVIALQTALDTLLGGTV